MDHFFSVGWISFSALRLGDPGDPGCAAGDDDRGEHRRHFGQRRSLINRCFRHQLLTQAARSSSLTGAAVGNRFGPEHVIVPMLTSANKDGD